MPPEGDTAESRRRNPKLSEALESWGKPSGGVPSPVEGMGFAPWSLEKIQRMMPISNK